MLLRAGGRLELYAMSGRRVHAHPPAALGQALLLQRDTCENSRLQCGRFTIVDAGVSREKAGIQAGIKPAIQAKSLVKSGG